MPYDRYIWGQQAWDELVEDGLGIIVDPVVYRMGQLFLEGSPADERLAESRWGAIQGDIGALIAFFDLIVLHSQLPAFNYDDTFDPGPNLGDPLGEVVNTPDDRVIVHVDVEHQMYRLAKEAAIRELQLEMDAGPFVTSATAREILDATAAIQYEWSPHLEELEPRIQSEEERRVAQFLLGQLVFTGYAQQTGAPHVLAPRRSRLLAAVGIQAAEAGDSVEAEIFDELRRRSKDAGSEWRVARMPWRPSFLPLLVQRAQDRRYRAGPDVLLDDAKDIRESKAVRRYREIPGDLERGGVRKTEARRELIAAAEAVAKALNASRRQMTTSRNLSVEVLPAAGAKAAGAIVGGAIAGPPGAALGGAGGLVADEVIRRSQNRLFGWALEGLMMRSARKILSQAVLAEFALRRDLVTELRIIWEAPRRQA